MEDKIFVIEKFLDNMLVDILELQVVVSSLYEGDAATQNEMFLLYSKLLEDKINNFTTLRIVLRENMQIIA